MARSTSSSDFLNFLGGPDEMFNSDSIPDSITGDAQPVTAREPMLAESAVQIQSGARRQRRRQIEQPEQPDAIARDTQTDTAQEAVLDESFALAAGTRRQRRRHPAIRSTRHTYTSTRILDSDGNVSLRTLIRKIHISSQSRAMDFATLRTLTHPPLQLSDHAEELLSETETQNRQNFLLNLMTETSRLGQ
jgi:hypothetical protein